MDLTKKENDFKIVEYNCWNASGLYKTNIPKIFNTVNEFKEHQMKNKKLKP